MINLKFLDHVAIHVEDIEKSATWYESVLGLQRVQPKEWQPFPIFMLSGKTGIAIFPMKNKTASSFGSLADIRIDHFAFNVDQENFEKAKKRYDELELEYDIQDHHYFHSIYTLDPDGHKVELTTIMVDENDFYPSNPK